LDGNRQYTPGTARCTTPASRQLTDRKFTPDPALGSVPSEPKVKPSELAAPVGDARRRSSISPSRQLRRGLAVDELGKPTGGVEDGGGGSLQRATLRSSRAWTWIVAVPVRYRAISSVDLRQRLSHRRQAREVALSIDDGAHDDHSRLPVMSVTARCTCTFI